MVLVGFYGLKMVLVVLVVFWCFWGFWWFYLGFQGYYCRGFCWFSGFSRGFGRFSRGFVWFSSGLVWAWGGFGARLDGCLAQVQKSSNEEKLCLTGCGVVSFEKKALRRS